MVSTAHLAGNPYSNRETIETHSISPSDFSLNHEITYTAHKSKCMTGNKHS
jgi:hypothetical protein